MPAPLANPSPSRFSFVATNSTPPMAPESHWLFSEQDLLLAPSVVAGLSPLQERENRAKGVNFILQVGIMLKLPQITLASASVFLHRFFMRYPMVEDRTTGRPHQHYYSVAATCLFLATKVEENCRKMRDLVVACVRVAQKQPSKEVDEQDKEFWRWRDTILQLEDLLLEALCFDLSLDPPYRTLFNYLLRFGEQDNKPLRNAAWAFVNDSCLTPLCQLYSSRTIAATALYCAARHCAVSFLDSTKGQPWWEVIDCDLKSIRRACNFMADVYENAPLKGGTEESMYRRTPEDGDEALAKTRQAQPLGEVGRFRGQDGRRRSDGSNPTSDTSRKRGRGGEESEIKSRDDEINVRSPKGTPASTEDAPGARDFKRRRPDMAAKGGELNNKTGEGEIGRDAGGPASPPIDNASEEGEVEA